MGKQIKCLFIKMSNLVELKFRSTAYIYTKRVVKFLHCHTVHTTLHLVWISVLAVNILKRTFPTPVMSMLTQQHVRANRRLS